MIAKQDILDRAAEWGLRPDVVEKDYVLGWLLAIHILWILGIIALVVGLILLVAGHAGHEVGGRRHWW